MKPSLLAIIATLGACAGSAGAADATTPIDYTRRNAPLAPADRVTPEKQKPVANGSMQEKRVEKITLEKQKSPLQERAAAVDVKEAGPKNVREKESHRPEVVEHPMSAFNHRPSAISTGAERSKPPTVAKFQDSLTAASATNMARYPAVDRATTAKINRFVFRKNPPDPKAAMNGAAVVPAAGGSGVKK
ncbi:MAG: hypothetical protein ACREH8_20410 [Opitutaceae bacterium]